MLNKMIIIEMLKNVDDSSLRGAEQYLNSKKVYSVKYMQNDGFDTDFETFFEAFIEDKPQEVLMPYLAIGHNGEVVDICCQCNNHKGLCIHKIALLLAAQFMIEAQCPDYHMAHKRQAAKALEDILDPSSNT